MMMMMMMMMMMIGTYRCFNFINIFNQLWPWEANTSVPVELESYQFRSKEKAALFNLRYLVPGASGEGRNGLNG